MVKLSFGWPLKLLNTEYTNFESCTPNCVIWFILTCRTNKSSHKLFIQEYIFVKGQGLECKLASTMLRTKLWSMVVGMCECGPPWIGCMVKGYGRG